MRFSRKIPQTLLPRQSKLLFGLLFFCFLLGELRSQNFQDVELKANYLLRFSSFVHWKKERDEVTTIGVVGARAVADELEKLVGLRVEEGREIRIIAVEEGTSIADVDVLFIGRDRRSWWKRCIEQGKAHSVVTVGEERGFLASGGLIEFSVMRNRLRFSLNLEEASSYGLSFSSKLVRLAL